MVSSHSVPHGELFKVLLRSCSSVFTNCQTTLQTKIHKDQKLNVRTRKEPIQNLVLK